MKSDQPGVAVPLSQGLLEHAHSVWIESCKNIRVSCLHRDVARVLTLMGLTHTLEQLTEDSLFSVDIALTGAQASPFTLTHMIACSSKGRMARQF